MDARDVHNIAKALSQEEFVKLFALLKIDVQPKANFIKKKIKLPDFTINDGIRYLIDNQLSKTLKP
jgi:hypothetical protein